MSKPSWGSSRFFVLLIWVIAVALRLYGATTPAQTYDMGTFQAWGNHLLSVGSRNFFDNIWSDYLPLPILTFAIPTWIVQFFQLDFSLVFKLFHSFLELILIFIISKSILLHRYFLTFLLLLSPALIGNTAFWGQVDSIPSLLALLSLTCLVTPGVKSSPTPGVFISAVIYGLSVAYKPIMILSAPIIWIVSLKKTHHWWSFPLISGLTFFLTAIPTGGPDFIYHIFNRVFAQVETYPYLTINAFNFWSLIPTGSWLPDSLSVFSLSAHNLGLMIFFSLTFCALNFWRKTNFAPIYAPRLIATVLILFYTFTTRMHERHLLFGLPFLALAIQSQPFLLIPYTLYTILYTLNLYGAFSWVTHSQIWPFSSLVISLISWSVTLCSLALALIWSWSEFLKTYLLKLKTNKLLVSVLILATLLRFVNLSYPPTYIFDEVYHAFTARQYLHNNVSAWEWWTLPPPGVAYEWTHPPLAKYGMVIGLLLFGENSFAWRLSSAVFGVASILGIYLLTRALFHKENLALLAAFLLSIEGLHLAQSRIAMNDIYMLSFFIWSLYAGVKSRWKPAAILFGLALASKWSALYGLLPLALIYLHQFPYSIRHTLYSIRLLLISLAIYVLTFAPFILAGHTWSQWWQLHRQMWYYHTHLVATHAYQSTPLEWLFDIRPVWYYVQYLGDNLSNIYALGNPLILWLGLVALILQIKKIFLYPYSILYTLYFILFVPWFFSPRIMFVYHYLPGATFLTVILAAWLTDLPPRHRLITLLLCSFITLLISPMLYGFPMPHLYWDTLFKILPSWK